MDYTVPGMLLVGSLNKSQEASSFGEAAGGRARFVNVTQTPPQHEDCFKQSDSLNDTKAVKDTFPLL